MQVDKHLLKSPSKLGGGKKVARSPGSMASDYDRQQVLWSRCLLRWQVTFSLSPALNFLLVSFDYPSPRPVVLGTGWSQMRVDTNLVSRALEPWLAPHGWAEGGWLEIGIPLRSVVGTSQPIPAWPPWLCPKRLGMLLAASVEAPFLVLPQKVSHSLACAPLSPCRDTE